MALRLAPDVIEVSHGSDAVWLRPSLRAAMRLQRTLGLWRIEKGLNELNFGVVSQIVQAASEDPRATEIFARMYARNGAKLLLQLRAPLAEFVADCFGIDPDGESKVEHDAKAGEKFDIAKAFDNLFEIATGWLHWTPAEALAATPGQIIAAHKGHMAKLKAIHGSAEERQAAPSTPSNVYTPEQLRRVDELGFDPAFDRAGLLRLKDSL